MRNPSKLWQILIHWLARPILSSVPFQESSIFGPLHRLSDTHRLSNTRRLAKSIQARLHPVCDRRAYAEPLLSELMIGHLYDFQLSVTQKSLTWKTVGITVVAWLLPIRSLPFFATAAGRSSSPAGARSLDDLQFFLPAGSGTGSDWPPMSGKPSSHGVGSWGPVQNCPKLEQMNEKIIREVTGFILRLSYPGLLRLVN
jgi:hypothetical protein